MPYYATIRRGKTTHIIEGPYDVRLNAELARSDYFFTSYDVICDKTPSKLKINETGNSWSITVFSIIELPDWSNGSLYGNKARTINNKVLF